MSILSALLACTGPTTLSGAPSDAPTWHQDVAPIVSASCTGCHAAGAIAEQWPFTSYEDAAPYAALMASYVKAGLMPPFPAEETPECANPWGFTHDPRPSEAEIATLAAWADAGAPEGDPATAAPLGEPEVSHLPRVDQELHADTPYPVPPASEAADTFACFVVDPGLTADQWLTGVGVDPDDSAVVHHALVYLDPTGSTAAFPDASGWYDCFGGTGGDTILVGGYAPGSPPLLVPEGAGIFVAAGTKLVVQMHYHGASEPRVDDSAVQLMWTTTPPSRPAVISLLGNASGPEADGMGLQPGPNDRSGPEFRIPAGAVGHTETMRFPIETGGEDYALFAVANHLHLVGTRMRAWVERGDGSPDECLLDTPRWDFDWQLIYGYDPANAPVVRTGDTLVLECTYDDSLGNPGVVRALSEEGLTDPLDVYLGEGSLDEMCIFFSGVVPVGR